MGGGATVHVIAFTIRGEAAVKLPSVPRGSRGAVIGPLVLRTKRTRSRPVSGGPVLADAAPTIKSPRTAMLTKWLLRRICGRRKGENGCGLVEPGRWIAQQECCGVNSAWPGPTGPTATTTAAKSRSRFQRTACGHDRGDRSRKRLRRAASLGLRTGYAPTNSGEEAKRPRCPRSRAPSRRARSARPQLGIMRWCPWRVSAGRIRRSCPRARAAPSRSV